MSFPCSKNRLWLLSDAPLYCGSVTVPRLYPHKATCRRGYQCPFALQNRLRDVTDITEDDEEKEGDSDGSEEAGAVEQWVQTEVEAAPREGTNNNSLVSSGVLLQPKTLVENHTQNLYR